MDKDINCAKREFRKHDVLSLRNAIEYCQKVFEDNKNKPKQTEVSGLTKVFTQLVELKESLLRHLVLVAGSQSVTDICTSTQGGTSILGGRGGLDLTSSSEAKFGARSSQVHQIREKTWELLLLQDAKVGEKSQFWGQI